VSLVKREDSGNAFRERIRRDPEALVERLCAPMRSRLGST
jgi:hypothetical protein